MEGLIGATIQLGLPLLVIVLALLVGGTIERRHYRSIDRREQALARLPLLTGRRYPTEQPVARARLVTGSVVISYDYFKRFLAGLRQVFGGEVKAYVSLLDRGRREAALRMKESCRDADLVVCFRVETSSISKGQRKRSIGAVEVFAYGTAIWYAKA